MNYTAYIASVQWKEKRIARLEMDGHKCRLCDEDGSRYRLEVHHRPSSYKRIPNESIADDLITVCARCHELITDVIREDRYGRRELPEPEAISIQTREVYHGLANTEIPVDFIGPADSAQRADGRPAQQVVEITQADFVKARQNRRGL